MYAHNTYIDKLRLIRSENTFVATICCVFLSCETDYKRLVQYLHTQECKYYKNLKFEKRIRSYLIGRFAAKRAIAALIEENNLKDIAIEYGIFNQPLIAFNKKNIQVSITHCDDFGAAIAYPEGHPMGIDIEKINMDHIDVLERNITADEKEKIDSCPFSYETGLTLLWTAKEALSKILKTGLMTSFEVFEVSRIELYDNFTICYYKNFAQYKVASFTIGSYMVSVAYPLRTNIQFDIAAIREKFTFTKSLDDNLA